jgi:hypothetical protein
LTGQQELRPAILTERFQRTPEIRAISVRHAKRRAHATVGLVSPVTIIAEPSISQE